MEHVLVLNADLGPLHRVSLRHAIRMLCREVAVDHVLPRSRGGRNTWLNTVAACGGCNQRKGDRTPAEARMPLRFTPRVPSWAALVLR
jgi:5-methylcytosine-specific restriction endonuclease McrA